MQKLEKYTSRAALLVFAYIPFHAFISTWLISNFGAENLIKGLKDLLVCLIGLACIYLWYRKRDVKLDKKETLLISAVISLLILQTILAVTVKVPNEQLLAGLIINTRYFIFAASVFYISRTSLDKRWRKKIVLATLLPFGFVVIFGLFQTLLPKDFLRHFGYGVDTIMPYQTVDNDESTIRIISTLRGPNPLGAYLVMLAPLMLTVLIKYKDKFGSARKQVLIIFLTLIIFVYVLFNTYSRSALIAAFLGFISIATASYGKYIKRSWPVIALALFITITSFTLVSSTSTMQKVLFHRDPQESSIINSDDKRLVSLNKALLDIKKKPFGHGVGSAGLASTYGDEPVIIENHFLDIWYQLGVGGLIVTLIIFATTLSLLNLRKHNSINLAVMIGLIAASLISLFWPVFSDETVSYIIWGLVGLVLASGAQRVKLKNNEKAKA